MFLVIGFDSHKRDAAPTPVYIGNDGEAALEAYEKFQSALP